jgi:predicted dienelactone hydrolase
MQPFEALFLALLAIAILRVIVGPRFAGLTYSRITLTGLVLLMAGLVLEGWRWQLLPAGLAFVMVVLVSLTKGDTGLGWRLLGAVPLSVLVGCSAVLAWLMPVVSLPAPAGPYGVGTFDFSITDPSRIERYSPGRKRELYVEAWYPADMASLGQYPVRTLFHDLYRGDSNRTSLIFGYLKQVDTHSHVNAPVAASGEGAFPVLLFNHALDFGFTSQNLLLMEHLASHGYVILSIAHPYQTAKVNLAEAGTIFRASGSPGDIVQPRPELPRGIVGTVFEETKDIRQVSLLKSQLLPLAEKFLALDEAGKAGFIRQSISLPGLEPFQQYVTEGLLEDFFYYDYATDNSLVQYWVEDNQFIADSLATLPAPVAGFLEMLDLGRIGVFGMSHGGAAAGEFCKIDSRCKAGVNLDGTQFGRHWDRKMPVPFLMFYNDEHQGGNDYAYMPPVVDFWDLRVKGATHMDFTDFSYLWPILKLVGFSGSIDGMRMMQILDSVQLEFFDHYLKGKPVRDGMDTRFPEIAVRQLP